MCPDEGAPGSLDDFAFCKRWATPNAGDRFYYLMNVETSKAAFAFIFVEMSIYLTYYKDVVFSTATLINYYGMLYISRQELDEANMVKKTTLLTFSLYQDKTNEIYIWLIIMVTLNSIWLLVTLITDYDCAFYRKAFVYKRRVERALKK